MSGFTKLFSSIVASSIWCEDDRTRIVWVTMLALADRRGIVEAAVPGLANAARVTVDDCRAALAKFESPDPDSRSTAHEGRRIEKIEGGWRLLNYEFYRHKLSADERREYKAAKQAEYRAKKPKKFPKTMDKPSSPAYRREEEKAVKKFENGEVDKDFVPVENGEPPSAPEMMR
jgi:hypothetical protein